ncbi:FAD-dependent oxidoreductase [Alistipes timonensis]
MLKRILPILGAAALLAGCGTDARYDLLIVGGGASGTAAGITAARMGSRVLLAEETPWLGGMLTAAGVSAVDGNHRLQGGFFGEFCDSLAARYGGPDSLRTGWVSNVLFEPSVGNAILQRIATKQKTLKIRFGTRLLALAEEPGGWRATLVQGRDTLTVRAKVLIDATELGDVAALAGVGYDIGMDARAESGEAIAPEAANDIVQDLTYVAILQEYDHDVTIPEPEGYDKSDFACSCRSADCVNATHGRVLWSPREMLDYGKLPNGKYMLNWPIEGNDYYANIIELSPAERAAELEKAKQFTRCFIYYIQHELGFRNIGLAKGEFPTGDGFPLIPYHRESRRIHGRVRFTVEDAKNPYRNTLYRTGIAVGDYPVDHHHQRHPQWQSLPELHFHPIPSYTIPLAVMLPQERPNLIVAEKSGSVSNLVNGTTRLQPITLELGQAAGVLGSLAAARNTRPELVPVRDVQRELLAQGCYLLPYLDLPRDDVHFAALQRIGATGLLRGVGTNVGWSNQTWFHADKNVAGGELAEGLRSLYPAVDFGTLSDTVTVAEAGELLRRIAPDAKVDARTWDALSLTDFDPGRKITRGELAVLFDHAANPFDGVEIDLCGQLKNQ